MTNLGARWQCPPLIEEIVDLLVGACVLFVAYATFKAAADSLDLIVAGVIAVVGIGLMLEPDTLAKKAPDFRD